MKNLVLIGLSGCGKSTFGRKLAKRLRLPLLDTDVMIEKKTGRSIPDIFAADGESGFRDIESACAREAAAVQGGRHIHGRRHDSARRNMKELSKNGLVVFIDRHPSRILRSTTLKDRPLVQDDRDKLFRLYARPTCPVPTSRRRDRPNHGSPRTLKRRILQVLRHYRRSNSHV